MGKRPVGSIETWEEVDSLLKRAKSEKIEIPLFSVSKNSGEVHRICIDARADWGHIHERRTVVTTAWDGVFLSARYDLLFFLSEYNIKTDPVVKDMCFGYLFTNRLLAEVYRHHQANDYRQPQSHQPVP